MNVRPCNRYLLVSAPMGEAKDEPTVLVPDDYKPKNLFAAVEILRKASDCTVDVKPGDLAIVNNSMIEKITFKGFQYYLLLENHVVCSVEEEGC